MDMDLDDVLEEVLGPIGEVMGKADCQETEAVTPQSPKTSSKNKMVWSERVPGHPKRRKTQKEKHMTPRALAPAQVDVAEHVDAAESMEGAPLEAVPHRAWLAGEAPAATCANAFMDSVDLSHLQGACFAFPFATDCSGGEAPGTAWGLVFKALRAKYNADVSSIQEFASEHTKAAHAVRFLRLNHGARVIFADMHQRTPRGGRVFAPHDQSSHTIPTTRLGGSAPLPQPGTVCFYAAGFECNDFSTRNTNRKKHTILFDLPRLKAAFNAGIRKGSADFTSYGHSMGTFLSSVVTIVWVLPRSFTLENVDGCPAEIVLEFLRWALPMYDITAVHADAADYGCCSRRFRLFVVGCLWHYLRLPLDSFSKEFAAMAVPRQSIPVEHFLLAAGSSELQEALRVSECRAAKNKANGRVSDSHNTQWGRVHSQVRRSWKACAGGTIKNMVSSAWSRCLTHREADLANLATNFVDSLSINDAFCDIGELAEHGRQWSGRALPPLLSSHKVWWVKGQRPLLGVELLFAMGYPHDVDVRSLTDRETTSIAGKTISVQILSALFCLLLRYVDFAGEARPPPPSPRKFPRPVALTPHQIPSHPHSPPMLKLVLPGLVGSKRTRKATHIGLDQFPQRPVVSNQEAEAPMGEEAVAPNLDGVVTVLRELAVAAQRGIAVEALRVMAEVGGVGNGGSVVWGARPGQPRLSFVAAPVPRTAKRGFDACAADLLSRVRCLWPEEGDLPPFNTCRLCLEHGAESIKPMRVAEPADCFQLHLLGRVAEDQHGLLCYFAAGDSRIQHAST